MSVATSSLSVPDTSDEEKLNDFKLYCPKLSFYAPDPSEPGFRRCQLQGCVQVDTEGMSSPVQRLLSSTKRVMSDCRKLMGPESLSAVACLTVNKVFWAEGELMASKVTQEVM